jgi:hypothetical protein
MKINKNARADFCEKIASAPNYRREIACDFWRRDAAIAQIESEA